LLLKFIVTFAPAGTDIELLSKAMFCAVRSIVTFAAVGAGVVVVGGPPVAVITTLAITGGASGVW